MIRPLKYFLTLTVLITAMLVFSALGLTDTKADALVRKISGDRIHISQTPEIPIEIEQPIPAVLPKPEEREVRGLYLTASSAASTAKMESITKLVAAGNLNALVIDMKDYSGSVYFDTNVPTAKALGTIRNRFSDLKALVDSLHAKGIYVIARFTVFQDPLLSELKKEWSIKDNVSGGLWKDYKGLSWVDPTLEDVWQYNIDLAKDSVRFGFDELNFDYIRFPSDGPIKRMSFKNWDGSFSKKEIMNGFFASLHQQLKDEPVYLSADFFGLTTIRTDDMNIGQNLEGAAPFFDYICPMMYPSHYPSGFMKFSNPANNPYEIIAAGVKVANERLAKVPGSIAKIRPWIQDFDIGAVYGRDKIQAQIKAIKDAGGYGFLSWNARNVYIASEYK